MKLLDAVNLIMPKLGERPVTSLQAKHPTLAVLLPVLEVRLRSFLLKGWWFNQYTYTAHPSPDGTIRLGLNTLSFVPEEEGVATRGLELFKTEDLSYTFTEPVKGRITQYVQFDDLPESAAHYVFYSALIETCATDLGQQPELQVWQRLAGEGWDGVVSEHLRQKKFNTRKTRQWQKYRRALRA